MSAGEADAVRVAVRLDGEVAVILIDNPPVNAASRAVRLGLLEAVRRVDADGAVRAVVIAGAGATFVAGADIREFSQPLADPALPAVLEAIAASGKPFVAAIHGSALGGGLELALACDARIAARDAQVGFPEVTLGIIPGAGGTQWLPRLVGVARAIELICSARRVKAAEALELGLVDAIAAGDIIAAGVAHARVLDGRKRRLGELPVAPADAAAVEAAEVAALRAGRKRPHVVAAIESVKNAAVLPIAAGLAREREVFLRLRASDEAAALRHLFFAEREAGKAEGIEGAAPRTVDTVGVVGAGTMGAGIALCFADAGLEVRITDQDEAGIARGMERMRKTYQASVASGRLAEAEAGRRLARIRPVATLEALADCDLVIEAVFEDMAVKKAVFARLDGIARAGAILATNTSYLDVDAIASATSRPGDVLGLHFFSPANVMRLLEIVRAARTSPAVLATALDVGRRIGKLSVIARVGDGFIGNRIYAAYRQQGEFMLEEGAMPEEIDAAIEGFGFAMGPFAVADLAGLDIAWRNRQRLAPTRDPRARYVGVADRLCEQGRFGQKTGAGWYRYPPGAKRGQPDPEVAALVEAASAAKGIERRTFTADEIRLRALATMVNEAAKLLQEGVAQRPSDVDLVLVNGYGFPKHEGGPLFWASRQARARLGAEIDRIAAASGVGFVRATPAALDAALRGS